MAQTPKMIDFELGKSLKSSRVSLRMERLDPYFESLESSVNAKSEYEHVEHGEGDLVATELTVILNGGLSDGGVSIFSRSKLVGFTVHRPPKVLDAFGQIGNPEKFGIVTRSYYVTCT
jgi:hypothetical protein